MASTKREKELARQRAERQAARRQAAERQRKQRRTVLASTVAVVLLVAVAVASALALRGGDDDDTDSVASATASSAPSADASAAPAGTCAYPKSAEPAAKQAPVPPTSDVDTTGTYDVTLATNRGDIVFEMDSAAAPCTANSLRSLASAKYFDGTSCHRLTTEGIEVLQCGDPTGTGSGGPGYSFADENLEGATYPRGTVAMANSGPGTNGSQFFLVYGDSTLPPDYTPFGRITKGLEVLDEVAAAGSEPAGDGKPKSPVQLETVRAAARAA